MTCMHILLIRCRVGRVAQGLNCVCIKYTSLQQRDFRVAVWVLVFKQNQSQHLKLC